LLQLKYFTTIEAEEDQHR